MTTKDTITEAQIEALKSESFDVGDLAQVAICGMALGAAELHPNLAQVALIMGDMLILSTGKTFSREQALAQCVSVISFTEERRANG